MIPAIELRLLRYVIAVAEELHFSRAALRVHVAQPSLSKQIRELEDSLGVRLFDRTNREVRITQAGRLFVKEAAKALAHSEHAIELAQQAGPSNNGCLLIGYTPRMNLQLLSGIRRLSLKHRREFPVSFHSSATSEQIQSLLAGSLQAGFVTLPVRNESLSVRSLFREPLVVVLPEAHPLASKREVTTTELRESPVIFRARQSHPASHDHLLKLFRKAAFVPRIVQEATTVAESLYLVREGFGIAFLKLSAIPPDQGFAFARISDISLFEETGFAYRRDNHSKRLQEFVAFLKSHCQEFLRHCQFQDAEGASLGLFDTGQLNLF